MYYLLEQKYKNIRVKQQKQIQQNNSNNSNITNSSKPESGSDHNNNVVANNNNNKIEAPKTPYRTIPTTIQQPVITSNNIIPPNKPIIPNIDSYLRPENAFPGIQNNADRIPSISKIKPNVIKLTDIPKLNINNPPINNNSNNNSNQIYVSQTSRNTKNDVINSNIAPQPYSARAVISSNSIVNKNIDISKGKEETSLVTKELLTYMQEEIDPLVVAEGVERPNTRRSHTRSRGITIMLSEH